jgi:hypothetical protein
MAALGGPSTVHICVVGDEGVGKTSLITAAATETFPDHPPPVLPPAKLPADTTPEGVPVVITDTSSRPEDKQALELACREASVIVLCFSMERPNTLRRISSYWMPELRRLGVNVPVMLVGCKSDVRPADRSLHEVRGGKREGGATTGAWAVLLPHRSAGQSCWPVLLAVSAATPITHPHMRSRHPTPACPACPAPGRAADSAGLSPD